MRAQERYTLDQHDDQRGQCSVNKNHDLSLNGELVLEFIRQEIHNLALGTNACQLGISDLVEHVGTDHADDEESRQSCPDNSRRYNGEHELGLLFEE